MTTQEELQSKVDSLFSVIAHGDDGHRDWLGSAIKAHFTGSEPPEYVASKKDHELNRVTALNKELFELVRKMYLGDIFDEDCARIEELLNSQPDE